MSLKDHGCIEMQQSRTHVVDFESADGEVSAVVGSVGIVQLANRHWPNRLFPWLHLRMNVSQSMIRRSD